MKQKFVSVVLALAWALGGYAYVLEAFENTNFPDSVGENGYMHYHLRASGNNLYATSKNGIYKYSETSNSWACFAMEDMHVYDFIMDGDKILALVIPENASNLNGSSLVKHDCGTGQTESLLEGKTGCLGIAQLPSNAKKMMAAFKDGIRISEDFGATWTVKDCWCSFGINNFFGFNPLLPNVIYFTTANAADEVMIYRSMDSGDSWEVLRPDAQGDNCIYDISVDPNDADHLFFSGNSIIMETCDGGKTWRLVVNHDTGINRDGASSDYPIGAVRDIMYDPYDSSTLFAVESSSFYQHMGILKSTDNGATWTVAAETETAIGSTDRFLLHEGVLFRGIMYMYTTKGIYAQQVSTAGIESVRVDGDSDSDAVYDLMGRRADNPAPGQVYISQGKKFIMKP